MKIIIPTTVLISPINAEVLIYSLIFTGFYMHFMSMLFELVLNDDLKTKTYLFMSLMQILSIKDYATNSNMIDISCALSL